MYHEQNKMVEIKQADIQNISFPMNAEKGVTIDVLRLDKIHPVISGNKWFKLKYHLEDAKRNGHHCILTFGGAYSNHILATAFAARQAGLGSIGIIRGEKNEHLSQTLKEASSYGMQLQFVSRDTYNKIPDHPEIAELFNLSGKCYVIPEGGAGVPGIKGCEEMLSFTNLSLYTHIIAAVGTGTMFLGLANASISQEIIGIPVLKGFETATAEILEQVTEQSIKSRCRFIHDYHFGGYAKKNEALTNFMNRLYRHYQLPTDFVYTGKLFYAINELVEKNYFPPNSQLLAIHSGGLQGNRSLPAGTLVF